MSPTPAPGRGMIRSFVALEVPDPVKKLLDGELAGLRRELPRASWVRRSSMHLTLKFLGEQPRSLLDELATRMEPLLAALPPVVVHLAGSGVFPNPARARVAWVGGEAVGAPAVAAAVEEAAASLGLPRERRGWTLHLTVARLRSPWPPDAVSRLLSWGETFVTPSFTCDGAALFASRLTPEGAVYTPLQHIVLGGPQS